MDGTLGLNFLPVYMRGGIVSQGLGNLLGNALALLFVARHGLKEGELWAMLATLRARPPDHIRHQQLQHKKSEQEANRDLLARCYASRGQLEDYWMTCDHTHSGDYNDVYLFI
jgi:hypothetical protein